MWWSRRPEIVRRWNARPPPVEVEVLRRGPNIPLPTHPATHARTGQGDPPRCRPLARRQSRRGRRLRFLPHRARRRVVVVGDGRNSDSEGTAFEFADQFATADMGDGDLNERGDDQRDWPKASFVH